MDVSQASEVWKEGADLRARLYKRIEELEDTLQRERQEQAMQRHDLNNKLHLALLELAELKRNHRA